MVCELCLNKIIFLNLAKNKKVNILGYIKMKRFCIKDTIKGDKGQSTKWEMIIADIYLTKDIHSDYVSILYKSIRKKGNP